MIGKRLVEFRENKGLTQSDLAQRTGIEQGQISRYEQNKSDPSLIAARILAKALGIQMEELFDEPLESREVVVFMRPRRPRVRGARAGVQETNDLPDRVNDAKRTFLDCRPDQGERAA